MLHLNSLGLLLPRGNKTDLVFEEIARRYAANNAVEKTQNGGETQIRNTLRRISSSQMLTRNTPRVTARTTLR